MYIPQTDSNVCAIPLCDIGKHPHVRSIAENKYITSMKKYVVIFVDNVSDMLENILPCAIKQGKPKCVAEDERAESPDKNHAVHQQH